MVEVEKIIKELCPNGVEYTTIDDICDISRGQVMSKDFIRDNAGEYPVYSSQTENDGVLGKISTYMFDGEYLTWTTDGANAGAVFYRNGKFSVTNVCGLLKVKSEKILPKFLYYALSVRTKNYVNKGMGNPKLMSNVMARIQIPLPPLAAQREIVRVLDKFTLLSQELAAELAARRAQYEFYRDSLLTFEQPEIRNCVLGDIATVTKLAGFEFTKYVVYSNEGNIIALRGLNVKNGKLDLTDVKYIDNSDLSKLNRSKLHIGDMLFTYVGTIGQVALVDEEDKYYLAPNVALIRCDRNIMLPEYMRYYFQSNQFWQTQINRLLQSSSMQNIPMEKIRQFELKVPSIEIQKRIVNVLDNFDKICSDLKIGLPAEIEKRQQQYEYYRDKLLTFNYDSETIFTDRQTDRQTGLIRLLQYVYGFTKVPLWVITYWDKKFNTVEKGKQSKSITYPYLLADELFSLQQDSGNVFLLSTGEKTGWTTEEFAGDNLCEGEVVTLPWGKSRPVSEVIKYYKGKFVTADNRIATSIDVNILSNKYLYYWLQSVGETIDTFYRGSGIKHPNMGMVLDLEIPLPTIEEQLRIVGILDKFYDIAHDLQKGLPAEIEARQQQYEYYRDKLLNFNKLS